MRICSCCGLLMFSGYVINAGEEYYCSSNCLGKHYTSEQWNEMYGDDSYYTVWEPTEDDPLDYIELVPEEMMRIFAYNQILKAIEKSLCSISTESISQRVFIILIAQKLSE